MSTYCTEQCTYCTEQTNTEGDLTARYADIVLRIHAERRNTDLVGDLYEELLNLVDEMESEGLFVHNEIPAGLLGV